MPMIDNIRLQNFRSYSDGSFEFEPGVNIIVGPNGSGKTNLLESILVLTSGSSYRARGLELIKFDQPWSRIDGQFTAQKRTLKIVCNGDVSQKTFELDDKPFKRLSLERTLPVVLFEPNHLQQLSRGPEQRRLFFDDILERLVPGFKALSAKYRRTLAQRNALLKFDPTKAREQLFAWNIRLSELAAQIVATRLELISDINTSVSKTYSSIANHPSAVKLVYDSDIKGDNYSSHLLSKLEASTTRDFARGFTGHGPHREDVSIRLNNQPAATTASRGEMRSLLLALKIIELNLLQKARDQKPIFLLDDVFSELDGSRRQHLVESLKDYQTLITTTEADAVMEYFSSGHKLIALN